MSRFPKVSPQIINILPPVSPSPVTPGFPWRLCLPFPSFPAFSFPPDLCLLGKGLKSPTSLFWDGPGEYHCKGEGVASTHFPRPRARLLSAGVGGRRATTETVMQFITLARNPLHTQSLDTACCVANLFKIATNCWPASREMDSRAWEHSFPS